MQETKTKYEVREADPVAYCVACGKFVAHDKSPQEIERLGKKHVEETEHEVIIGRAWCLTEEPV